MEAKAELTLARAKEISGILENLHWEARDHNDPLSWDFLHLHNQFERRAQVMADAQNEVVLWEVYMPRGMRTIRTPTRKICHFSEYHRTDFERSRSCLSPNEDFRIEMDWKEAA
jgi:hypothetical protein